MFLEVLTYLKLAGTHGSRTHLGKAVEGFFGYFQYIKYSGVSVGIVFTILPGV